MNLSIDIIDAVIVVGYLAGVLMLGLWVGRGQKSTVDYFLGDRSLPGWAILLSIVATETSTVTFLSIPGITFALQGDLRFLQITFGYIVGRLLIVFLLLPLYFRGQPFTSYEVLQQRYGSASRRTTSVLFLVTRNLSDALRLYLTALVLQQVVGLDLTVCVVLLGVITIAYTYFGGVKSVIWNDCLQFIIYMIGAVVALCVVFSKLPGGAEQVWQFAQQHDKLRLLDFDTSLTKQEMTFWAGLIGGLFLTAGTHGTDQLMVQRYLSAKTQRSAAMALAISGVIVCLQFLLFLGIGIALSCFYDVFPPEISFTSADKDRALAHFIVNHLNVGLVGLMLAAVFAAAMSTLSSSLNSSATSLINDIWLPLSRSDLSAAAQLRLSRLATAGFGVVQIGIALVSHQLGAVESTVMSVLKITGFATGPILGLYLLAVLARRVEQRAALVGFGAGLTLISIVALGTDLYWPWYAAVGALATFLFGWISSLLFGQSSTTVQVHDK